MKSRVPARPGPDFTDIPGGVRDSRRIAGATWHVIMAEIRKPHVVMALLLLVALGYWLWYGLVFRSIQGDDQISILAAKGILEFGFQKLPSGFVYHRAYLPNHLVAASIRIFGDNQFSIMFPSLLMALGSFVITFLISRRIMRRPWLGVIAVALLLLVQMQAIYATSPRMYMSLQFFTMLAVYSGWRGYVEGQTRYQALTFVAITCAILSHRAGISLIVTIPITILIALWLIRSYPRAVHWGVTLGGAAIALAAIWFMTQYTPPNVLPSITVVQFGKSGFLGLNTNLLHWFSQVLTPTRAAIYLAGFLPFAIFAIVNLPNGRWRRADPGTVYALTILTLSGIGLVLGTVRTSPRLWMFVLPIYMLMLTVGLTEFVDFCKCVWSDDKYRALRRHATKGVALAALAIVGLLITITEYTPGAYARGVDLTTKIVGPWCRSQGFFCEPNVKQHYYQLRQVIAQEDLIIASNPFVAHYYLGRVDGYLRDKVVVDESGNETIFDHINDEYFGVPLFEASDLESHANESRRLWVIMGDRAQWLNKKETLDFVKDHFIKFAGDDNLATYVSPIVASEFQQ